MSKRRYAYTRLLEAKDAEIEQLKAEIEQFRAALEEIEEYATSEFEDGWCGDIAREALAALEALAAVRETTK